MKNKTRSDKAEITSDHLHLELKKRIIYGREAAVPSL